MSCLLCLKIYEYADQSISINSNEWLELNVEYIVEKYFWKMENLQPCTILCEKCRNALYNFHIFYTEIKQAHTNLRNIKEIKNNYIDSLSIKEVLQKDITKGNKASNSTEPYVLTTIGSTPRNDQSSSQASIVISATAPEGNFVDSRTVTTTTEEENPLELVEAEEFSELIDIENIPKTIIKKQEKSKVENIENVQNKNENIANKLEGFDIASKERICDESINEIDDTIYESDEEPFEKPPCQNVHYNNVHEQKSFECDICGKCLSTAYTLKSHKLLHYSANNEKVQCKESNKFLNCQLDVDEFQLKIHTLKHAGKTAVNCEICGRRLSDKKNLKRHMNLHLPPGGIKTEFKCHICTKFLTTRNSLARHIKVVHEDRCVKCTVCEQIFKRPEALQDHMAKHMGEPLHACGWCPIKFCSISQMHSHRKNVHPIEWMKMMMTFSGKLPDKYFTTFSNK